jgi:hypothetical protein
MKKPFIQTIISASLFLFTMPALAQEPVRVDGPKFTADGQLELPADYRRWVFLSSGFDMTYGPARTANPNVSLFSNVFVSPEAYDEFIKTGSWPDGSQFALEIRMTPGESSDQVHGKFQKQKVALEILVRDSERFEGNWGFFDFPANAATASMIPYKEDCYSCHLENAAVDSTFVQFYPTLIDVAREKGVFRETGFE